jgi:hypothetical protein
MPFLYHAANMVMRHKVNRSVAVRVKTNAGAYAKFYDIIHDEDFLDKLSNARANPKGTAAREIVSVPWGSRERAAEMTKLIADHRFAGTSSIFYSVAPDDVHNPTTIRWAAPYTGEMTFPAQVPSEFSHALQGKDASERTAYAADGSILYAMDET